MAPITEIETHKKIIDAAIKAGVKRLILSDFGTNVPELQTTEPVPIYQGKVKIREYMERREDAGLTWTGVVVRAFFDWFAFQVAVVATTIFDSSDTLTNFTLLSTVGKATSAILEKPAETANRYVFINSFRTTQNHVLATLKKATGEEWKMKKTIC
ncbi:hypothetical protein OEA41_000564 [Lepraria neglecta]|uniref:NmrA-like domain-containing protein n=1 Tax=Lepraria neglecta TaxID=209136 RepID=A0AAD9ZGG5_9LECA|nr:hypothetical protein OEA41_000564 [Lepraria neglecta]